MQYANRECNAIMTIVLARPPLGSLVVRLITGDAIRISGVGHLGVAIQSLPSCRGLHSVMCIVNTIKDLAHSPVELQYLKPVETRQDFQF